MFFSPSFRLGLQAIDVLVQLFAVDTPDAAPADLDSRQVAGSDEGINLRNAHGQVSRDVFEGQKARFESRSRGAPTLVRTVPGRHVGKIAPGGRGNLDLSLFARVCSRANAEALI